MQKTGIFKYKWMKFGVCTVIMFIPVYNTSLSSFMSLYCAKFGAIVTEWVFYYARFEVPSMATIKGIVLSNVTPRPPFGIEPTFQRYLLQPSRRRTDWVPLETSSVTTRIQRVLHL